MNARLFASALVTASLAVASLAVAPAGASVPPKITHVVILIQENRSFDNVFNGFPGADTVTTGRGHDGRTIGQSAGTSRCSTVTCGNCAVRFWAVATAAADPSQLSRLSQRAASCAVSTPIEQPGSNARR